MKLLTRAEELILISIWQLKEEAYCIPIRDRISQLSGEEWSLGSIYMPLDRLSKRDLLSSYLTESTPERGGRHKRIYELTEEGKIALRKVWEVQNEMWKDVTGLLPEQK
ncbi:MAG: PadR family transcriptional regulator [Bacteroidetes bacterium]|nr:PadR family transcriptional regulator [Bacteroidota bacterium]